MRWKQPGKPTKRFVQCVEIWLDETSPLAIREGCGGLLGDAKSSKHDALRRSVGGEVGRMSRP